MFLGKFTRVAWLMPAALYICLILRMLYLCAFEHKNAFDVLYVFGILSLPSSLLAHAITSAVIGEVHGYGGITGAFAIMAICGVAQYLVLGLLVREGIKEFLAK